VSRIAADGGATTQFRGQKDSNWEGGWRVPCFIRWPGQIKAGLVLNGIVSHIDMFPTPEPTSASLG